MFFTSTAWRGYYFRVESIHGNMIFGGYACMEAFVVRHSRPVFSHERTKDESQAKVELKPIAEVPASWNGVTEMYAQTLEHEKKVTAMIHSLCCLASDEKDFATAGFLQWFVSEQVEEEATATGILDALKCIGDDKAAVYAFSKELGAR